jgi:hypothetical protein
VSIYLEGTLPWLFDPDSPELGELAREANTALFGELLRDRHFGVATGRVPLPEVTAGPPARVLECDRMAPGSARA